MLGPFLDFIKTELSLAQMQQETELCCSELVLSKKLLSNYVQIIGENGTYVILKSDERSCFILK